MPITMASSPTTSKTGATGRTKMNNHEHLQLRDPNELPTQEILTKILGASYPAYEALQDILPSLEIEQEWQWYTPHKAWLAKGQHYWTTPRGTHKEKNLYWLHVFEGSFAIAIWFKTKNRDEILLANLTESTKQLIANAETFGKVPTFPVIFKLRADESLADICTLIECKKCLEK